MKSSNQSQENQIRLEYDESSNSAYLYVGVGNITHSIDPYNDSNAAVVPEAIDIDENGKIIGFEWLNAREVFSAETLDWANKIA